MQTYDLQLSTLVACCPIQHTELELEVDVLSHEATWWNLLASMLRHIGSRQARLVHFTTSSSWNKALQVGRGPRGDGQGGPNIAS